MAEESRISAATDAGPENSGKADAEQAVEKISGDMTAELKKKSQTESTDLMRNKAIQGKSFFGRKKPDKNIGEIEKEIGEIRAVAQEYKDMLLRLQAEFENSYKREERERREFALFAGAKTVMDFLPMMDSIEEGEKQAGKSGNNEMKTGFEILARQFALILEKNGVKRIDAIGKKFDHSLHEAILTGNEEGKVDGLVLEELHKGYTMNGKVLRPAKVKINRIEQHGGDKSKN